MPLIDRAGASALIPEEASREIIQGAVTESAVLRLGRRLPNMTRAQQRMPVLSVLPTAGFVNGDTGLKPTTEVEWANKYLNAEEIAVIVPIPENVLADADYDIWGEVIPRVREAIGAVIDGAVLVGTNAPADWPDDLLTQATAAGHVVDVSTQTAAGDDLYDMILGEGGMFGLVEADGFQVTGSAATPQVKAMLRELRDAAGQPVFHRALDNGQNVQAASRHELDGTPIIFLNNGAVSNATLHMISGDWSQLVYSIRQDMTFKILSEAVIQDNAGNIIYNLPQQDMVALRVVMRLAWQVPNPINKLNPTEATRWPFAALVP